MPGLIDCHVHARHDVRALSQALAFGVTTELDMFSDPGLAAQRRSLAASCDDVADIRTAVQGATVTGGTFSRISPGQPAHRGRPAGRGGIRLGSGGARRGLPQGLPGRLRLVRQPRHVRRHRPYALVTAARTTVGMLAVAHADSAAMARVFIQAGGDALAHVLSDLDLTPAFLADLRHRPAFVIATLRATAVLSAAHATEIEADQRALASPPAAGPLPRRAHPGRLHPAQSAGRRTRPRHGRGRPGRGARLRQRTAQRDGP